MTLYVRALAGAGRGFDAPYENATSRCDDIPIKDYASATLRRRFGKLARLMYVAAGRALANAHVEDPSQLVIVTGTALGEATVSLDLLTQIHETAGAGISPSLVPNSVHNSPAGYLTIGLSNRRPSVTVSQGWLSAPAALAAAEDYLSLGLAEQALVVVGDEADPAWIERLASLSAPGFAGLLATEGLQETAVALVVGSGPSEHDCGSIRGAVLACDSASRGLDSILDRWSDLWQPGDRVFLGGEASSLGELEASVTRSGLCPTRLTVGIGSSGGGALALLAPEMTRPGASTLYAATERRELGVMHILDTRSK